MNELTLINKLEIAMASKEDGKNLLKHMMEEQQRSINKVYSGAIKMSGVDDLLTDREIELLKSALIYANGSNPSGLPAHNLMIIISKLFDEIFTAQ